MDYQQEFSETVPKGTVVEGGSDDIDRKVTSEQVACNLSDNPKDSHRSRRLKNEANLTAGIGTKDEKQKKLDIFWTVIWPKLEEAGWKKIDGVGARIGGATFLPKGSSIDDHGLVTGEHYERIRDVLNRLDEGRSQTEAAISNLYREKHIQKYNNNSTTKESGTSPNRPVRHSAFLSPKLDLSWKDGGRNFPRKKPQVGDAYQVSELPKAGSFDPSENFDSVILWDTEKATALLDDNGKLPLLLKIPPNKREVALELLANCEYIPGNDFVQAVTAMSARNGSDWSSEKKRKFSESIFSSRKDMNTVKASMNIDMTTCLAYYYGVFKHTDDYRLLKTILHEERMDAKTAAALATIDNVLVTPGSTGSPHPPQSLLQDGEPDACVICDDGGELLICDGCEREYHMECMDPPLQSVPEGNWECDECVNQKLLSFRDYLVRQSGLFECREEEDIEEGGHVPITFKPTVYAMESIRKMADGISNILTTKTADAKIDGEDCYPSPTKSDDTDASGGKRKRRQK